MTAETTHKCPVPYAEGGDGLTPCCGYAPFELPTTDRLTLHDELVTCQGTAGKTTSEENPR